MLTARKLGLGLLFLIIGYLIGRYYLPAIPANTLSLASLRAKPGPATPIPAGPAPQAAAPPVAVAPPSAAATSAFPTPYPTPSDGGVATTVAPVPAAPASSRPSLYPTPYPTPSEVALLSTPAPAPVAVNRAPAAATAPAPAAITLDSLLDRQSHFPYLVLGLIALAVLYKKRSDERIICVTMLILGIILGHYVDPGPINFTNPFTKAG